MKNWFNQFGIDEALTRRVMAAATAFGADDADLYFEHSSSTAVALSDHKVNRCFTSVDLGVGIRVVINEQVGYAYTEDLTFESMCRAAKTASEIARGSGGVVPVVGASDWCGPDYYPVNRSWSEVEVDVRIPLVRKWEQQASPGESGRHR